MGNSLSKIESLDRSVDRLTFKDDKTRGILKANAMSSVGVYFRKINEILTPVEDRFPPQACNLERDKKTCLAKRNTRGIKHIYQYRFQ